MADTELAFHYLIVVLGFTFFCYFLYGYLQNAKELAASAQSIVLRVPPTFANPVAYARVTYVIPTHITLTMRVVKRFWMNHGFKLVFLIGFSCYAWNVWSESLSDDPFTIVGVSPSATPAQVRRACRQGSLALHPDKHPGQEEEIRPKFEKHTRACKVLNDEKLREKYVKWGTLPKSDKDTGGEPGLGPQGFSGGSILSVGGGSWMLTFCFFFLLFVGVPSYCAYYLVDMLYDEEAQLAKIVSDCKALSEDMKHLYTCGHLNGIFLDIAQLYLVIALAEFAELKVLATKLNPRGAKALDSLLNKHQERYSIWEDGNSITDKEQAGYDAKCKKVDKDIDTATGSIDNVAKKKGSFKTK